MPSENPTDIDPDDAHELLAQMELVQSQVRWSMLANNWWFFLLWGVIVLGSIIPPLFLDAQTGFYWIVAGPLGAIISFMVGHRTGYDVGTVASPWPYVAIAGLIFAGTWGSSLLLSPAPAITGVFVSLAVGFSLFALLDRQYGPIAVFAFLVLVSLALVAEIADTLFLYSMNAIAYGMAFLSLGLGLRVGRPHANGRGVSR